MSEEEEGMMVHTPHDGAAAREAIQNYMMYISRMSIPPAGFDPRRVQAYPMLTAAQMPLLLQSANENTMGKVCGDHKREFA